MIKYNFLLFLASAVTALWGANPPAQPLTGPGGSNSPYATSTVAGPFNDGPACPGLGCNHGLDYYIYQPATPRPTSPLPVILFLHGYSADDPTTYGDWIDHVARKGYTVIWINYDNNSTAGGDTVVKNVLTAFPQALAHIAGDPSFVPAARDAKGLVRVAIAGHSGGAYIGFRVAALSTDPANGVPPIRAVAAINPGQGNLPSYDLSAISSSLLAGIVVGSDENTCEQYVGAKLYDALTMLPPTSKTFLEAWTDTHGSPDLSAVHNFPATSAPAFPLDALDWYASFKISVALFDCAFHNTYCSTALANSSQQTDMGKWSDRVPVTPMTHFTTDPLLTFPWPSGSGCAQ